MLSFVKKYWLWIVAVLYTLLIFRNSFATGQQSGSLSTAITQVFYNFLVKIRITVPFDTLHFFVRKAAHFSEFFVLGFLVYQANIRQPLFQKPWICILLWMILPPLMDEAIQLFTPGRSGMVTDSLIDMSGYLLAWLLSLWLFPKKEKQE